MTTIDMSRAACGICTHMSPEGNCPIHGEREPTTDTPVETLTPTDPLAPALAAVLAEDSSLDAIVFLLRKAGSTPAEEIDVSPYIVQARLATVCWLVAKQLSERWDATTRSAPRAALAEVVRDVLRPCDAPSCDELRAPWESSTCDSAECVAEVYRAFGDV